MESNQNFIFVSLVFDSSELDDHLLAETHSFKQRFQIVKRFLSICLNAYTNKPINIIISLVREYRSSMSLLFRQFGSVEQNLEGNLRTVSRLESVEIDLKLVLEDLPVSCLIDLA